MASGNTVTLTFAGDSTSLERAMGNVGSSAKSMSTALDKAGDKSKGFGRTLDSTGAAADGAEGKFMGTADLLDGLGGAFGLPTEGATGLMRSFGDLSGGFAVLQPMIGSMGKMFTGLASTLMAPPMGIILLIAGLVAALVIAYQKSETFRDIVNAAFEKVKQVAEAVFGTIMNVVSGVFNWVKDNWKLVLGFLTGPIGAAVLIITSHWDKIKGGITAVWDFIKSLPDKIMGIATAIKDALLWPYKTAFNLIAKIWNSTVGKLSFEIPSWVPGLGGKGFSMPQLPEFHTGGIVPGPRGAEVPILAMAGETVTPAGAGPGAPIVIQLVLDGRVVAEVVRDQLLRKQRTTPLGFVT